MAICLTGLQSLNLRYRGQFPDSKLEPVKLSDGRYAVSEATISDRRFALFRTQLSAGTVEANSGLTTAGDNDLYVPVDSKSLRVFSAEKDYAIATKATGVFRFETRSGDFGYSGDGANNNRRSEMVASGFTYGAGETLWVSFSFVVGPDHVPFDPAGAVNGQHNIIHQWHSVDTTNSRSPVCNIELNSGNLEVNTRSDSTGSGPTNKVVHYNSARPTDGTPHSVVISGLLGQSGHLNVWLDGAQILNLDTPIGYYNDDAGARDLAYPHWGIYQKNVDDPAVVYHANIEWGTTDLSARIAAPLTVPALTWL